MSASARPESSGTPLPSPSADSVSAPAFSLPFWAAPLLYLLLAALFLWRAIFLGEAFLPAGMLGHVAPWSAQATPEALPPWNPLRWDGIAQFYPWRFFAAETLRAGTIPLWNPYQFCGTPFVANSQSAVFYPGNLLFVLLPVARAFGVSALLHLTLAGWLTYLLLRRLRCGEFGALLGGVVFTYSAWEVAWLQLPTFLATSCWFPLLLRQIHIAACRERHRPFHAVPSLGVVIGLMLLAGHLQIAFYGLMAGTLFALCLLARRFRQEGGGFALRTLGNYAAALLLGVLLALPQILPSVELSRVSHRAGQAGDYTAYVETGLPPAHLITLGLPDFFGGDTDPGNPYFGFYIKQLPDGSLNSVRHNAAETALFVGVVPLLLGGLALLRAVRRPADGGNAFACGPLPVLFFGGLALLALLLALGTPLNALFYFGVPGFKQSGSPTRSLVLWALASGLLAGFGLDTLLRRAPTRREIGITLGMAGIIFVIGLSLAAAALREPPPGVTVPLLGDVIGRLGLGWLRLGAGFVAGAFLLLPFLRRSAGRMPSSALLALVTVIAELFLAGIAVNPTAPMEAVYPMTPGLTFLKERLDHERVFPVNQRWSLYNSPPAVLPPNAATVYGFHDVQGYDSLFTGQYKAFANRFARLSARGVVDASPPEVGNMVFFQNPNAPDLSQLGAAFAVTPSPASPAFVPQAAPPGSPLYDGDREMAVYALPTARPRAALLPGVGHPPSAPQWEADTPTRVSLRVNAGSQRHVLCLADQNYPGWRAALDGKPVRIRQEPNSPVGRYVEVPAGEHRVTFEYAPASFRVGLYLACLSVFLLTALISVRFSKQPTR